MTPPDVFVKLHGPHGAGFEFGVGFGWSSILDCFWWVPFLERALGLESKDASRESVILKHHDKQ